MKDSLTVFPILDMSEWSLLESELSSTLFTLPFDNETHGENTLQPTPTTMEVPTPFPSLPCTSSTPSISSPSSTATISFPNSNPTPAYSPKRRLRASQEQLAVLEHIFASNTSPSSKLKESLASQLGMSERSVQIWFQNRRAKQKLWQRRRSQQMQHETLRTQPWIMANTPCSAQDYGASLTSPMPQAPCSAGPQRMLKARHSISGPSPYVSDMNLMPNDFSWAVPHLEGSIINGDILTIGNWQHQATPPNDISFFCNLKQKCFSWIVTHNLIKYKMMIPFNILEKLQLSEAPGNQESNSKNIQKEAKVTFTLSQPPAFFVYQNGWASCGDFTQLCQASIQSDHILQGQWDVLKSQIMAFVSCEPMLEQVFVPSSSTPMSPMRRSSMPIFPLPSQENDIVDPTSISIPETNLFSDELQQSDSGNNLSSIAPSASSDVTTSINNPLDPSVFDLLNTSKYELPLSTTVTNSLNPESFPSVFIQPSPDSTFDSLLNLCE